MFGSFDPGTTLFRFRFVPADRKRRCYTHRPIVEEMETRTLLSITSQYTQAIGSANAGNVPTIPFRSPVNKVFNYSTTQPGNEPIAPLSISSGGSVTDPGITGNTATYSISLQSSFAGTDSNSGSVSLSGTASSTSTVALPLTGGDASAGFEFVPYDIGLDVPNLSQLMISYNLSSSDASVTNHLYIMTLNKEYTFGTGSGSVILPVGEGCLIRSDLSGSTFSTQPGTYNVSGDCTFSWQTIPVSVQTPDLAMNSASLSSDGMTVNAAYSITGAALPSVGTIDFYWASGPTFADTIGNPIKVATKTAIGSYTSSTSIASLGQQPANASYILAVADSPNADPVHNVAAVKIALPPQLPDIVMDTATTTDSSTVTATYDIASAAVTQPLTFNIYRSAQQGVYTASDLIGVDTLPLSDTADLSAGHHTVVLNLAVPKLLPDPAHEFVTVVANPNKTVQEQNYSNNGSYFRIFILGAVSHGYIPALEDKGGATPTWELDMAQSLMQYSHYDYVIPFNWVKESRNKKSGEAEFAGAQLATQIAQYTAPYEAQHSGNIVDLHLIGHSRGSVVISQAMLDIVKLYSRYIVGSYIRMTFLDPHPASNYISNHNYMSGHSAALKASVRGFQNVAKDPAIVVPAAVSYAEDFYQNTPYQRFSYFSSEHSINLWGHGDDGSIVDDSTNPINYHKLTSQSYDPFGRIGHSEVYQYYQIFIINQNKNFSV